MIRGAPRVETDIRGARDEGVVVEALVLARVLDDQDVAFEDRVRAEGGLARGRRDGQTVARLKPLAVGVDQGHQRDRDPDRLGDNTRDPVERLLGRRVENREAPQAFDTPGLVAGKAGEDHSGTFDYVEVKLNRWRG